MNLSKFAPRLTQSLVFGLAFLISASALSFSFAQEGDRRGDRRERWREGRGGDDRGRGDRGRGDRGREGRGDRGRGDRDRGREDRDRDERRRRGFDVEGYLKRIDANGNGVLESNEMNDRTKAFLERSGFNTKKPIKISKVNSKLERDKKAKEKEAAKGEVVLNIKGFGIDPEEVKPLSTFGPSDGSTETNFSDSVWDQVDETLYRYDRNRDNVLDAEELERGNFRSPRPSENDTNKDGKLSRNELAQRYADRESYAKKQASTKADKSRKAEREKSRASSKSRYSSSRSSSKSSSARSSSSRSSSTRSSSTKSSTSSKSESREKYRKYAASLLKTYDKDADKKLSKDELGKMRRPPEGADADGDGFVTESELLDNLTKGSKGSSSSSTKSDSSSSKKSSRSRGSFRSRSSRRSSGGGSSFDRLDENENKQIEMHEYSNDWDDEKVKAFYKKDKNNDGIISLEEWNGR